MKRKRPVEEQILQHVSVWDVTTSVGIVGMQIVEHVQFADRSYDDPTLDELVKTFETQLNVLANTCTEYETLFRIAMTELPPGYAGMKMKNPLYQGPTEEPSDKSNGSSRKSGDEFPF